MTLKIMTLNPGHFHAALVQKEMNGLDPRAHVYGPLGPDLTNHLQRIAGFNLRGDQPTNWELEIHATSQWLEKALREKPGDIVVLAGQNSNKIDIIQAAVKAGRHVLADKPWILTPKQLPQLKAVLDEADERGIIAYDIMTERYEITNILQGRLLSDESIFGALQDGSTDSPSIYMESVHYLKKLVAGTPLRRPPWFFDISQQGEALSDVGTHLVDLAMWMAFPETAMALNAIVLGSAKRWPTEITRNDFQTITDESDFPEYLQDSQHGGRLQYYCNNQINYRLNGHHARIDVLWRFEATPRAGDTHLSVFRGTQATIEIRQGQEEAFIPELYVVPAMREEKSRIGEAVARALRSLEAEFPGLTLEDQGARFRIKIPKLFRNGHEAHFGEVTRQFLKYVRREQPLPVWEKPNMLAKYFVTTTGVELSRIHTARRLEPFETMPS
jgi:predicted dehydrogenase